MDENIVNKDELKAVNKFEGWKRYLAYSYIVINVSDFVIMPIMKELTRPSVGDIIQLAKLDPSAQSVAMNAMNWQPLTLANGGLFHLAVGAILTGVAVMGNRGLPLSK